LAEGPELEQRFQNTPTSTSMWARIGPSLALYGFENAVPTRSPECGEYPERMGSMEGSASQNRGAPGMARPSPTWMYLRACFGRLIPSCDLLRILKYYH